MPGVDEALSHRAAAPAGKRSWAGAVWLGGDKQRDSLAPSRSLSVMSELSAVPKASG